eukprot:scaffold1661_cov251-Pinguiococcus_pyrenoidosus.AAC.23
MERIGQRNLPRANQSILPTARQKHWRIVRSFNVQFKGPAQSIQIFRTGPSPPTVAPGPRRLPSELRELTEQRAADGQGSPTAFGRSDLH